MLTSIYLTFMQIHERAQEKMICVTTTKLSNYLSNYLNPTWHVGQFFCRNRISPSHTLSSWETLKTSNFWLFIFWASVEVSVVVTVVSSVQRPAHFLVLDKISKINMQYFMSQKIYFTSESSSVHSITITNCFLPDIKYKVVISNVHCLSL